MVKVTWFEAWLDKVIQNPNEHMFTCKFGLEETTSQMADCTLEQSYQMFRSVHKMFAKSSRLQVLNKSLLHTTVCPAPVAYCHRGQMSTEWVACLYLSFLFIIFVLTLAFTISSVKFYDKMLLLYNRLCVNEAKSSQLWISFRLIRINNVITTLLL